MENQLTILAESLEKKKEVLARIQEYNKRQEEIFLAEDVDMDGFDRAVEEKGKLIDELTGLDKGFELLYERLAKQLKDEQQRYAVQIRDIQHRIAEITEMGMTVQTQEQRNKQLIEQYFAKQRGALREKRAASKAAYHYYKKVNHGEYVPPQFMDNRQ